MLRKERAEIVWRFFGILEGENFLREKGWLKIGKIWEGRRSMLRKKGPRLCGDFLEFWRGENFLREKEVAENRKNLGGSEIDVEERKGRDCVEIFWNSGGGKLSKGERGG